VKGLFTPTLLIAALSISGCELTLDEKEKLDNAATDLSQLADQIIITYPVKNSEVSESIVTVQVDIPANTELQELKLLVDGKEVGKDTNGAPWEIQWPAYYFADGGPHSLLLKAVTNEGIEIRNNEQFQLTVNTEANDALAFNNNLDGTQIKDSNAISVSFNPFPGASRYQVEYDEKVIETNSTELELIDLDVGSYDIRYRAIFDYSELTTLTGPYSEAATIEVLAPTLPPLIKPVIENMEDGYQVTLSWEGVTENDSYTVFFGKTTESLQAQTATTDNSLIITGLKLGQFQWQLKRTNALSQSSVSEIQSLSIGVYKRQFGVVGDIPLQIISSADGGSIILASTKAKGDPQGDNWFIKIDSNGVKEWEYILRKPGYPGLTDLREFSDGSIYAIGSNGDYNDKKGYLIKLSGDSFPEKRLVWELEYREPQDERQYFSSLTELNNNLYVVGYNCTSILCTTGNNIYYLYDFDMMAGALKSAINIPNPNGALLDGLGYLATTTDNNFLLSCAATPEIEDPYFFGAACIMEFDTSGKLIWSWDSIGTSTYNSGRYAVQAPWGGRILAGQPGAGSVGGRDDMPFTVFDNFGVKVGTYTGDYGYSNQRESIVFGNDENFLRLTSKSSSTILLSTSRYGISEVINEFSNSGSPSSLFKAKDGGLFLLFRNNGIVIMKTDIQGNM